MASAERQRGLEVEIGRHRVVVPAALVARVVEVELTPPPPLAREWLGGMGSSESDLFVVVDLGVSGETTSRLSKCVILESTRPRPLLWGLRVDRSIAFVEGVACARPTDLPTEWPSWVKGTRTDSDSVIGLLDVPEMCRDYERA